MVNASWEESRHPQRWRDCDGGSWGHAKAMLISPGVGAVVVVAGRASKGPGR